MYRVIEFDLGLESAVIRHPLEDFMGLSNHEIESVLWSEYGHEKLDYAAVRNSATWISYLLEVTNGL
jgi:hypothetical protein